MTLYAEMLEAGVDTDNHESDLYVEFTPEAAAIMAIHPDQKFTTFLDRITGKVWMDIPFKFDPWWT